MWMTALRGEKIQDGKQDPFLKNKIKQRCKVLRDDTNLPVIAVFVEFFRDFTEPRSR